MSAQQAADLVCVTKDLGSLALVGPVAKAAQDAGFVVRMVAEEPAASACESRYGIVPQRTSDPHVRDLVYDLHPKAVIVGCSSPINQEAIAAQEATRDGTPCVVMSDIRGAWSRHENIAGLVLTVDETDAASARRRGYSTAKAVGFHQANLPPEDSNAKSFVDSRRRDGHTVVLAALSGQHARLPHEMACVLGCADATTTPLTIIVQAHPKILPQEHPAGGTWEEWVARIVSQENVSTDHGIVTMRGSFTRYADMTISPSSSCLAAAAAGNIGIGLRPTTVERMLAAERGVIEQLDFYERELGMPIVRGPVDLGQFVGWVNRATVTAFDPQLALQHIRDYAGIA